MRSQLIVLALIVLALALAHMSLGYLAAMLSGLAPLNRTLHGLATFLTFPVQQLPGFFHASPWMSFSSWVLSSLFMSSIIVMSGFLAIRWFGTGGGLSLLAVLVVTFAGALVWLASPAPAWERTGHRYLDRHVLLLPVPFLESAAELSAQLAIQETRDPGQPLRLTRNQWFWNYRSGVSGHPTYDAMVMGCEAAACSSLEEFLHAFTDQRDPTLRAATWQDVTGTHRWVMQTALPNRGPLPSREGDRVTRIYSAMPVGGVWLGILAYEARMPREQMISILEAAQESIRPMAQ